MTANSIAISELRRVLAYCPASGRITWVVSLSSRARRGSEAFTALTRGYKRGRLFNVSILAHRAAWALHYGEWPMLHIDHINGNPSDNRLCNLRLAEPAQNSWNSRPRMNTASGMKGVSVLAETGRWRARIRLHRKEIHLGYFETKEEAFEAYCAASERLHGKFGRTT